MGFRLRIALFFVAALVAIQALTAVLVYRVTRHELIEEGQRQLDVAAGAFARQLDDVSERVAASVQVLSLDYALRAAIAQRDASTLLSALRNHGRRVGADQMLVVDLDNRIEADTSGAHQRGAVFAYADLTAQAYRGPSAAVVVEHGKARWLVVVPVFAPNLVGFIAAGIPIDDAALARLQRQSALPRSVELATLRDGRWSVLASGSGGNSLAGDLLGGRTSLPPTAEVIDAGGREYVARALWLDRSQHGAPVAAVLGYSVDSALSPYRQVAYAWSSLLLLGLAIGLAGAWLIARGVSRPVEELAASARRIESGDYSAPPTNITRRDEIGALATAFATMTASIREREERILHQAGHDQVTGLANRTAAAAEIQKLLAADPATPAALLMVGLGHAPDIIKAMGHAVFDRMMRDAGQRLRGPGAAGVLARATDSQFALFIVGDGRAEAVAKAFAIVEALTEPYRESDLALDLMPAVGIALAQQHGSEADVLLRRAEVALITALGTGEPVAVYEAATDPHRPERLSLMGDLREAIEHGRLDLHYQPKLAIASDTIDGVEGLVRWQHPRLGVVMPDDFIGLAEQTGMIRRLSRWALATGIAQADRWRALPTPIRISINLSARDLDDALLPRRVVDLLEAHGVPAQRIVLEITESAIIGKPDNAIATLRKLADQGVDIAIDDFGVGQSSLSYLRRLPVRELKIDKSFIAQLAQTSADRTIVQSIVELGHRLGYRVTAEGVENAATLDYLRQVGCDHAQGYLIAAAMPVEEFGRFVAARGQGHAIPAAGTRTRART